AEDGIPDFFAGLVGSEMCIRDRPYTDINTYSQIGLSFSSDGKLRAVVGKSPIVSSMNCASPEFKKLMELYK
ncbi:hypothetical protein ACN6QZ_14465, partial [Acinetobacter baumannii]